MSMNESELDRLLELSNITIVSATERDGEINRKKANQMVDPHGYFQKNKNENFHGKGSFNEAQYSFLKYLTDVK